MKKIKISYWKLRKWNKNKMLLIQKICGQRQIKKYNSYQKLTIIVIYHKIKMINKKWIKNKKIKIC